VSVTHVIADLHLCEDRPDITEGFIRYLADVACEADHLFILGDFFEAWVGDDYHDGTIERVLYALQARHHRAQFTYFCHGNRDFLVGYKFCESAGIQLLDEETVVHLAGEAVLLMHGDSLCTDDVEYQAFRHMVRQKDWRQQFLDQPLPSRLAIAAQLRAKSKMASREKAQDIMDVNPAAVQKACQKHNVTTLIHGHTHRPADHKSQPYRRLVVGDWDKGMHYIRADDAGIRLLHWQWT
jgi:UDP-2,3-diacylglucosamine hydrolase